MNKADTVQQTVATTPPANDKKKPHDVFMSTFVEIGLRRDDESISSLDNFPGDKMTRLRLASKAQGADILSLSEHIGEEIELKHFFIHRVWVTSRETGEKEPCPRTVLIARDGTSYQAVSRGVYDSLGVIFTVLEDTLFPDGFKVKVRQQQTQAGNTILKLEVM